MINPVTRKSNFEFLQEFSLLIDHIDPQLVVSPSGYIMNLLSLLDEAQHRKAVNLLVLAPAQVYHLNFRMHDWVSSYLIPQMKHAGIERIAFCVNKLPEEMEEQRTIFGRFPEIGVFSSMPRAKAWILGVSDRNDSLPVHKKLIRQQ